MRSYKWSIFLSVAIYFLLIGGFSLGAEGSYTNRLINEKSPYLLQHAHNPVNWYPWGKEALDKARQEDKPIFLSIGYSTCHWCHVMEEESFSNPEIAAIMNKYFVSIKVDREERPDIDNLYMSAVMAMTGSGGWPLTVFLTPDKKPFYGGTYLPPEDRWGRSGLKTILNSIAGAWENQRNEVLRSSDFLTQAIQHQVITKDKKMFHLDKETLKKSYAQFLKQYDSTYGGFGSAPKFPMGHSLSFLLRYWKRTGEVKALEMVEKTLGEMSKGGIYDHIGGGFHRYSTDGQWRVPHFEKMLYDQAILARAYLEAYQATGKEEYAKIAKEIFEYVLRDMTHPEGGFYSAEDADSPSLENPKEKKEGAFYLWSKDEIINVLGKEQGEIFGYYFGIGSEGNALSDPQGEFSATNIDGFASGGKEKNILYVAHSLEETARHFKKKVSQVEIVTKEAKEKIFKVRSQRPMPHLDDKILVDWNGLMISSLSFGSRVLDEPRYLKAAEDASQFILQNLIDKNGRLLHRYRDSQAAITATLEDYAFFIYGLYDLYEATFDPNYLKEAKRLSGDMLAFFWDETNGGFFFTADDAEKLLVRSKEIYDGAIPSGNSIAALDLIRLGKLTIEKKFEEKAELLFKAFSNEISQMPSAYPQMLIALDFALGPSKEIVIAGDKQAKETNQMLKIIYQRFIPNKVVAFRASSESQAQEVVSLIPFLKEQLSLNGKTTAYVCENYVCKFPTADINKMQELLGEK